MHISRVSDSPVWLLIWSTWPSITKKVCLRVAWHRCTGRALGAAQQGCCRAADTRSASQKLDKWFNKAWNVSTMHIKCIKQQWLRVNTNESKTHLKAFEVAEGSTVQDLLDHNEVRHLIKEQNHDHKIGVTSKVFCFSLKYIFLFLVNIFYSNPSFL